MFALTLAVADAAFPLHPACAQTQPGKIDIPAGPLATSLAELSRQTGISVGVAGRMPPVRAPHVRGTLNPETALRRILKGSGLIAVRTGPMAFRLQAVPQRSLLPPPTPLPPSERIAADIIVTGTKRNEALATLPIALSVAQLRQGRQTGGLASSATVASQVDGLYLTNLGPGRNRQFVRGVADSPFNGPSQSTVSVQVDDYRATYSAPDPDLRLIDVDRVEILKGPQGALYGTGALGGVYHVVTMRPDLEKVGGSVAAYATAVAGGGSGGGGQAVFNLPLSKGRIGLRAVAYGASEPGWIDNANRSDVNQAHVRGGRLALRFLPFDGWTVDLGTMAQLLNADDSQYVLTSAKTRTRTNTIAEPHDNDFRMAFASIAGRIGSVDILSATNLVRHEFDSRYDATSAAADFGLSGTAVYEDERTYRLFNQEVRFSHSAPDDGLSWIAGASYLSATNRLSGEISPLSSGPQDVVSTGHQVVNEFALFGEASLPLFSRNIRATLGGRLFHSTVKDEKDQGTAMGRRRARKAGFTPSIALSWHPDTNHFLFLRYASALRPGGLSAGSDDAVQRFDSDELATFDLGSRLQSANGRFSLDTSVFLTRWSHIQSDYLLDNGLFATRNAGTGRIYGIESAVRWRPASKLTVELGGTVERPRLIRSEAGVELGDDLRLPVVPDLAFRMEVSQGFDIGPWQAQVEGRLNYMGHSRLSFDSDLDRSMGGFTTAALAASATRDGWTASMRIDNLLNTRGDSFAFGNPFTVRLAPQYTPLQPRTLTIRLAKSW